MRRTSRREGIPGQREALVAALRASERPPAGASAEEVRRWTCERIDRGWSEGETAIAAGLTVNEVREAVAERSA
jgi:hypothetical protein